SGSPAGITATCVSPPMSCRNFMDARDYRAQKRRWSLVFGRTASLVAGLWSLVVGRLSLAFYQPTGAPTLALQRRGKLGSLSSRVLQTGDSFAVWAFWPTSKDQRPTTVFASYLPNL